MERNSYAKLCIIDDIKSVVEGIINHFDWKEHGIIIGGTALNGEDGIELIRREKPDIILTDIRMPRLNGLDMVRQVLQESPQVKIVFFTGYTDFEYAQQAVKLGAFDFLTKPFSIEELVETVKKAKSALDEEKSRAVKLEQMERKLKESLPVLRQEYLSLLLRHKSSESKARERWDFLDMELEPENLAVMVLEIDGFADKMSELSVHEMELTRFALQNIVEETVREEAIGVVFRESKNRYVVLLNSTDSKVTSRIAESCRQNIERYTKFTISVGVGKEVRRIHELHHAYEQALSALAYHFYTGGNGVIQYEQTKQSERIYPRQQEREQELQYALRCGNAELAIEQIDCIFTSLTEMKPLPAPAYVLSVFQELSYLIMRTFMDLLPDADHSPLEALLSARSAHVQPSAKSLAHLLHQLCREGCRMMENSRKSEATRLIEQSIQFIRGNLEQDLTIQHCASQVHLSGSYYANLFKKITGLSVNQFIISERMDKAKQLLLQGVQVQEVAGMVGYEERRSFSEVFRKQTGMTPSEFKQRYEGERAGG